MHYLSKLKERCQDLLGLETTPMRSVIPEIRHSSSLVNGQIVTSDGCVVDVDLTTDIHYSFSDFSINNLSRVGYNPEGEITLSPSRFAVLDNLNSKLD